VEFSKMLSQAPHHIRRDLLGFQEKRQHPSVYLGVIPIGFDESGWRLGGWAEPREYTLVMRRLPEKRMLPFLLETQQITPDMMWGLAEHLAKFHATAERVQAVDPTAYLSIMEDR
jgi:aminoglycoside phosphotransferase family enzyme